MYQMCIRTNKDYVGIFGLHVPAVLAFSQRSREPGARTSCDAKCGKLRLSLSRQLFTFYFPSFLFSPEEFIDNPIDNLSITKNSKKMQKAVRGRQRPSPSYYSSLCQAMKLLAGRMRCAHVDSQ